MVTTAALPFGIQTVTATYTPDFNYAPNSQTATQVVKGFTSVSVPPYNASRNARGDVTSGHCTGNKTAGYVLQGMVRNSATSSRTYSIAVDFITNPGDTVMATRIVNVGPLVPNKSANWSTPAAGQGHANLNCVIRQALWS